MDVVVPLLAAVAGVVTGALLARRNEKRAQADKLLADALNDLVAAIADVAAGDRTPQQRYATATARVALHGSPTLVEAFRRFQDDANTETPDGRQRLLNAVQTARNELGRAKVDDEEAAMLLFGHANDPGPKERAQVRS